MGRYKITVNDRAKIERAFSYQAPKPDQVERYEYIRDTDRLFAFSLSAMCPKSPELDQAITNLSQVVMWANASIARNED